MCHRIVLLAGEEEPAPIGSILRFFPLAAFASESLLRSNLFVVKVGGFWLSLFPPG